jgi:hypothetical protein
VAASGEAVTELTPRELDVLKLVAQGLNNPEIAQRLLLSEYTVRRHPGQHPSPDRLLLTRRRRGLGRAHRPGLSLGRSGICYGPLPPRQRASAVTFTSNCHEVTELPV